MNRLYGVFLAMMLHGQLYGHVGAVQKHAPASHQREDEISIRDLCYKTKFYESMAASERAALQTALMRHDAELIAVLRTIYGLEEELTTSVDNGELRARYNIVSELARQYVRVLVAGGRAGHGGILLPSVTCCLPKDAHFREVVTGTLTVDNLAIFESDVIVEGSLLVTGTIEFVNLNVTGTAIIGSLTVLGNESVGGNDTISGNVLVGGTLTVTGSSTLSSLHVAGGTTLGNTTISTLLVSGNETVGGALNVTGAETIGNNLLVGGSLTVTGSSTLSSLNVAGGTTLGNTTITNLTITGTQTISGSEIITGNVLIGGTLTVTGSSTLSSLNVAGGTTLGNTTITNLTITGTQTISGSEIITGNVLIGGTLTVTGSSTLSSLNVAGGTTLGNTTITNLTITGTQTISGSEIITGNVLIGGTLTVTGSSTLSALNVTGGTTLGNTIITNETVTGVHLASNGSAGAPSYSFIASTSTGLYSPAANQVALSTNATQRLLLDNNGAISVAIPTGGTNSALTVNGGTGATGLTVVGNASSSLSTALIGALGSGATALSIQGGPSSGNTLVVFTANASANSIQVSPGSVTVPAYTFTGNLSTGLYSPSAGQFSLAALGVDKVRYDGNSVLVTSTYRVSAQNNAPQTITTPASNVPVPFQNVIIPSSGYNSTTGIYTVPVTGVYLISFVVTSSSTAANQYALNIVRTAPVFAILGSVLATFASATGLTATGTWIFQCTAGDTLQVQANGGSSNITIPTGNFNTLSIQLLSV